MGKRKETLRTNKRNRRRVVRVWEVRKRKKIYISSKSHYNIGIIFTITKVRGGDNIILFFLLWLFLFVHNYFYLYKWGVPNLILVYI